MSPASYRAAPPRVGLFTLAHARPEFQIADGLALADVLGDAPGEAPGEAPGDGVPVGVAAFTAVS